MVQKNNSTSNVNFGLKRYFKQSKLHVRLTFIGGLPVMTNRANDDLKENFKFCIKCYKVQIWVRGRVRFEG